MSCPMLCRPPGVASAAGKRRLRARRVAVRHAQVQALAVRDLMGCGTPPGLDVSPADILLQELLAYVEEPDATRCKAGAAPQPHDAHVPGRRAQAPLARSAPAAGPKVAEAARCWLPGALPPLALPPPAHAPPTFLVGSLPPPPAADVRADIRLLAPADDTADGAVAAPGGGTPEAPAAASSPSSPSSPTREAFEAAASGDVAAAAVAPERGAPGDVQDRRVLVLRSSQRPPAGDAPPEAPRKVASAVAASGAAAAAAVAAAPDRVPFGDVQDPRDRPLRPATQLCAGAVPPEAPRRGAIGAAASGAAAAAAAGAPGGVGHASRDRDLRPVTRLPAGAAPLEAPKRERFAEAACGAGAAEASGHEPPLAGQRQATVAVVTFEAHCKATTRRAAWARRRPPAVRQAEADSQAKAAPQAATEREAAERAAEAIDEVVAAAASERHPEAERVAVPDTLGQPVGSSAARDGQRNRRIGDAIAGQGGIEAARAAMIAAYAAIGIHMK
ncbi:unnamed protein product [Prorocentrum cordatum]|uniref:Uncharacterized protein n=1 Tax=Prorocentrum cordatum TaxID=2364126 RepID=A0ABN9PK14_9DINO|nr:unnamed protein product [Polarella glacialis]